MELEASPLCCEVDILGIIIDDESCDSVQSGIVTRDVGGWTVAKSLSVVGIIGIGSVDYFKVGLLIDKVADIDGVNLGDGGDGNGEGDSRSVSCGGRTVGLAHSIG